MSTSPASPLLVTLENGVKTIAFNQPAKKNALSFEMSAMLRDAIFEAREDDSRVIVLTGTGDDFCSGADLDPTLLNGSGFDATEFLREYYNPTILAMRGMNKPIIAKIQGACVGIGFNFALACDLLYAGEGAYFSQLFVRIGLSSDGGGSYFLASRVGYHRAFEMLVNPQKITADQAHELGIVNKVFCKGDLDASVQEMANYLINGPYLAFQHTKSNLRAAMNHGLEASLEQEAINQGVNFRSADFFEGVSAFLMKRQPKFKGK